MIKDMEKNYRILRRVHGVLYTSVAENFQFYINSLDQAEIEEINTDFIGSGLNYIQNVESATELLMLFDFFYFINGRYPATTAHTFIPRPELPMEVNGEEINIKNLYEKFRWTNSHGLVSSQFLAALNIFFGGNPEISQKNLTEFYQNMTVSNYLLMALLFLTTLQI